MPFRCVLLASELDRTVDPQYRGSRPLILAPGRQIASLLIAALYIFLPKQAFARRALITGGAGTTFASTSVGSTFDLGLAFKLDRDVRLTAEVGQERNVMSNTYREAFEQRFLTAAVEAGYPDVVRLHLLTPALHVTAGLRVYLPTARRIRPFGEIDAGFMRVGPLKYTAHVPTGETNVSGTLIDDQGQTLNNHESGGIVRIGVGASAAVLPRVEMGFEYRYAHFQKTDFKIGAVNSLHGIVAVAF